MTVALTPSVGVGILMAKCYMPRTVFRMCTGHLWRGDTYITIIKELAGPIDPPEADCHVASPSITHPPLLAKTNNFILCVTRP
jgi:hypothetical protein